MPLAKFTPYDFSGGNGSNGFAISRTRASVKCRVDVVVGEFVVLQDANRLTTAIVIIDLIVFIVCFGPESMIGRGVAA